ncbi:MAG: hypothetical protein AB8H03_17220 [Saprospiraceae bacterium]
MSRLIDFESGLEDYFSPEILSKYKKNTYVKWWLEMQRNYPIAIAKLRLREPKANLFAAKIMRQAMRFQMTEAVLMIAIELPTYHLFQGHHNQIEYYQEIEIKYRKIFEAEGLAKRYSYQINKYFIKKIHSKKLVEKIEEALEELDILAKKIDSYTFQIFSYDLKLKKYQLLKDDENILKICNEALDKMYKKRFKVANQVLFMFNYPIIPILIQQGDLKKAQQNIDKCYKFLNKKNNNWHVINSYEIILNFQLLNLKKVNALLRKVKTYPTDLFRERYELFQSYADLWNEDKTDATKYINTRFLNDVFEHQKDKQGYNIAIVIVKILHLLKSETTESYDKLIEERDNISKYLRRALGDLGEDRSKIFLEMLLQIPYCNFKKKDYEKRNKDRFEKLKSLPLEKYSASVEVELIRYEVLNNRVLDFLK